MKPFLGEARSVLATVVVGRSELIGTHGVVQSSVVGVYYVYQRLSTAHVHFTAFTRVLLVRLSSFRTT